MSSIESFFFSVEKVDQREGFSDEELVHLACKQKGFEEKIQQLLLDGFFYGGDTKSDSKAYTDMKEKKIYIGKKKSLEEACLSLFYEMINASNHKKFERIFETFLKQSDLSNKIANEYALAILRVEADALFEKCKYAEAMQLEHLIKNPKYLEIYRNTKENQEKVKELIFNEMVEHGTVHCGKKKAVDHYMEQYYSSSK